MTLWRKIARTFALSVVVAFLATACDSDDPLAHLRHSRRRPVEARLTGFTYAAPDVTRGAGHSTSATETLAIGRLKARVEKEHAPEDLHRLALAHVAVGEHEQARVLLEEACRLRPNDTAILSDLAATEMALGEIFDAAEHSAQALEHDPRAPAAAFNWALALDKLYNRPIAIEAWQKFLELDPSSGWSDEARQHLAHLREPRPDWERERRLIRAGTDTATLGRIHEQFPQRVRLLVQTELLPAWVASGRADDLAVLTTLAEARAAGGDPFLRDVVKHTATHRTTLSTAFSEYVAAVEAEKNIFSGVAAARYKEAAAHFHEADSPLAIAAEISAAANDSYQSRYEAALQRLTHVDEQLAATGNRYPGVAAQSAWIRGLILTQSGQSQAALASYRHAREEAKRAGETEHVVAINQLIASVEYTGGRQDADRARLEVLQQCDAINPAPQRMYTAVAETALDEWFAHRPRLALAFNDWQTRLARKANKPLLLAECAEQRATNLLEIGRVEEAAAAISEARAEVTEAKYTELRWRTIADIEFATGRIEQLHGRLGAATQAYSAAIRIWDDRHWHLHAASAYLARGEAALSAGDRAAAERDFRAGVAEVEAQRERNEPDMRVGYFEHADRLFEQLIQLLVESGRANEALSVAERKRARFLLDQIAQSAKEKPLDANAIAMATRGRTAILELALLDRQTSIWLAHDGRIDQASGNAGRAEIETIVARQLAAIAANDTATIQTLGRRLYDDLVAPIASSLRSDSDLLIVPDDTLQTFPFATLVMPDGRYFVEAYTLATAPSATVFLHSAPAVAASRAIVAVAQPAPRGFDALPAAAHDAQQIARLYGNQPALVGSEITPAEFLAEAARSSCVHFDGHATVDLRHPSNSALQFESRDQQPAALTAEAIAAVRLPARPLIVLAACSTGRGRILRNEGIGSLASAFLQARARGVVATLWDVKDAAAGNLFTALHKELQRGRRPADALREAQRSLIHSTDPAARRPEAWG
ncbi:MAG TPA: CHAT domain-containing tetratricopeptide repeat protein, partial [Thermoanaerobaculia bacterium]|nr:CHAT domain-containing tetratricopeptide repeat protein [Thermoanaerobaculia bacterium]